ncbi:MAG: hypothetical protein E7333_06150 [Clostridiales bacterium]|nr:hypothetical protein [Clostridiales bacterium]
MGREREEILSPGAASRQGNGRNPSYARNSGYTGKFSGKYDEAYMPQKRPVRRESAVYDDLAYQEEYRPRRVTGTPTRKSGYRGLWAAVALMCWLLIAALGLLMTPQLLGVHFSAMPNLAFVGGTIVEYDHDAYTNYMALRKYMATDTIYPGVYIDGVNVGGMTRQQATQAVLATSPSGGGDFYARVNIGGSEWAIDSTMVPVYRNAAEVAEMAYTHGRGNTTAIRGTRVTPFQERVNAAMNLRSDPVSYTTTITYDKQALRNQVDAIAGMVNRDPINAAVASFDFGTKKFGFSQDMSGVHVDAEDIFNQLCAALDSGNRQPMVYAAPKEVLAEVTKAELMNSFACISSFTTSTTSDTNRNNNIALSAAALNGRTVLPGETFSFNQATGERTAAKGYREAGAIAAGQSIDEIGGGVCQTSSTLFVAVACANLEIVERSNHAWPSTYVDKGWDATVNWPNLDFVFRNNTDWPIFIVSQYKNRKLTVEIYGMTLGDGVTIQLESKVTRTTKPPSEINYVQNPELPPGTEKTTVKARTGYQVETWQVWYQHGKEIGRTLLCNSNYKAYQETIEWN